MLGRWNKPQTKPLLWMAVLLDECPPCFSAPAWAEFLRGVQAEAMGDQAMRRRLERGWMPRYCESCTAQHRATMTAATRCHPIKGFEHGQ